MIGLKLPRLFYGRTHRQVDVGVRADFCEFCTIVCRHWVVSFQSTPTVLFVPFNYEEVKKESRCEVCRAQFPLAAESRYARQTNRAIDDLVEETNPDVVQHSLIEVEQIRNRASASETKALKTLDRNRVTNFLSRHEIDYRERVREFPPFVAVASIQATIVGLALAALVKWWLAVSFAVSLFLFGVLFFFLLIRKRIRKTFDQSAIRLLAVSGGNLDQLEAQIRESAKRFPRSSGIVHQQLLQIGQADLQAFEKDRDFVTLLDKLDKIPEL